MIRYMNNKQKLKKLQSSLEKLYSNYSSELLFHGWHHIWFVRNKALEFARPIKADLFLVESAALTHDLNYIVKVFTTAKEGEKLRSSILTKCGYSNSEITKIEHIIQETETSKRGKSISKEGMALSDGDSLFKVMPITPILFASKYISESKIDITILANKIVSEQRKLLDEGFFFYTKMAKDKYLPWAKNQVYLWETVTDALKDKDIKQVLTIAKKWKILP